MKLRLLFICASQMIVFSLRGQDGCAERVTTAGNVGMTISNLGLVGNAFAGSFDLYNYPSCEYPRNSGVEHLFQGGIWIGAKINGNITAVSTAAFDASGGYSPGASGFEFTVPSGACMEERSSLYDSPYYRPDAVSHQDFLTEFADSAFIVPGTNIQIADHNNPLGVTVKLQSYNWSYSFADFFVILNFHVTNTGANSLQSPYIGFWADGVVRNVNITAPGGAAFFNKGGNGYIDTLFMSYEFDATGDPGFTDSYIGMKFLGAEDQYGFHHPRLDSNFKDHYNSWQFRNAADPLYFYPTDDLMKYGKMEQGLNHNGNLDWVGQVKPTLRQPSNRSMLLSCGPFQTLQPGQSADIAFAFVLARKKDDGNPNTADTDEQKENLARNAFWAQTAYNGEDANFNGVLDAGEDRDGNNRITRYILPSPPDYPKTKIIARENTIELYWSDNAESSVDPISKKQDFEGYRVYKSTLGFDIKDVQEISKDLKLVAQFDKAGDGLFMDNGFAEVKLDSAVYFPGDSVAYRHKYVFRGVQDGWQHALTVTAFDAGDPANNLESLESSPLVNLRRVFPGKTGNPGFQSGDPFVYPNPYYAGATWEGSSTFEEDRKIVFANLPERCEIRIYTVAGDLVDLIQHDPSYTGADIRWFRTYSDTGRTLFPGGEHAWDLLSADGQIIARGIYLFSVKDLDSGKIAKGKFVVIK